jgi:D-alanyl-D-alanine carboxypeptidase (penicillin-binding protein 5/6)
MRRRHHYGWGILLATAVIGVYGFISYRQALPALAADSAMLTPNAEAVVSAPWPKYGQAALGVVGSGVVATNGEQKAVPTASVTKIMVALAVLRQKPLNVGQQGPTITVSKTDVDLFRQYLAKDGSVIQVKAGEKISEYQALEAMLLPSANNMADMLAKWAFGSIANYSEQANNLARESGLTDSHFGSTDASGFSPQTVSTAQDLVRLGETALQNPVIAQIVSQKYAKVPVAGVISNGNWRLDLDGVNGIKTGNTDQAGGVYLFSAKEMLATGQQVTIVGAIMGAPTLTRAMIDSAPLLHSAAANFKATTMVHAGQKIAEYQIPWGGHIDALATSSMTAITWKGKSIAPKIVLHPLKTPLAKGDTIGSVTFAGNHAVSVITSKAISPPTWYWRALRNL